MHPTIVSIGSTEVRADDGGVASLVVIEGGTLGERVGLSDAVVIGRASACEVVVRGGQVSRRHCEVWFENEGYWVRDLGSANGTRVDGERIRGERRLRGGEKIRVGETIFKVLIGDSVEDEYHAEMRRLISSEPLTGLYNKRFFVERAASEVARSRRYANVFSLVLFDVDHFKAVNDTYGHIAGDVVLKGIGQLVKGLVRESDVAARWGGEEFAVLAPEVGAAGARVLAEKLRRAVGAHEFTGAHGVVRVTISAGVSEWNPKQHDGWDDLVREADERLYKAKRGGRNQVVGAPEGA